jgi:hybrid cluster-associated redox disulfide protein
MKNKNQFVTKDMFLIDIISKYPEVAPILMGYGLHCVGCHFSGADTLEMGAKMHGMDDEILDMMIRDVNIIIEKFNKIETKKN